MNPSLQKQGTFTLSLMPVIKAAGTFLSTSCHQLNSHARLALNPRPQIIALDPRILFRSRFPEGLNMGSYGPGAYRDLYWGNVGLYWDHGNENGNYYLGFRA